MRPNRAMMLNFLDVDGCGGRGGGRVVVAAVRRPGAARGAGLRLRHDRLADRERRRRGKRQALGRVERSFGNAGAVLEGARPGVIVVGGESSFWRSSGCSIMLIRQAGRAVGSPRRGWLHPRTGWLILDVRPWAVDRDRLGAGLREPVDDDLQVLEKTLPCPCRRRAGAGRCWRWCRRRPGRRPPPP